uniref:Migration and invasion inhibitory protein n=1 Tax=Oryzias latipes TaxID=8090 RepID=A0A3P9I502_ORYLA
MSTARLDELRERNKHLLKQRKREGPSCRSDSADCQGRKPAVLVTLTEGDREPARAALSKPSVRFADTSEICFQHNTAGILRRPTGGQKDEDRDPEVHQKLTNLGALSTESCPVRPSRTRVDIQSTDVDLTSQSDERPAAAQHRLQPLLGYDWIAGVLDTEDSVAELSDEFFNDLQVFRFLNKEECVHAAQTEFSDVSLPASALLTDKDDPEADKDSHQCTFSYRINNRLFPVPLHSQDCCTVCKRSKFSHPHSIAEPALIRVNIPRAALLPPHKYKAHRRCSFDPSDSLGLPAHCLSGWSNTGQSSIAPPSSLDLRSNLQMKHADESPDTEMEGLFAPEASRHNCFDQLSDLSRLARHNYQHCPPRRLGSSSNPVSS